MDWRCRCPVQSGPPRVPTQKRAAGLSTAAASQVGGPPIVHRDLDVTRVHAGVRVPACLPPRQRTQRPGTLSWATGATLNERAEVGACLLWRRLTSLSAVQPALPRTLAGSQASSTQPSSQALWSGNARPAAQLPARPEMVSSWGSLVSDVCPCLSVGHLMPCCVCCTALQAPSLAIRD